MSDIERKYLIRSSGEVLGPYNKQEVIALIKKSKISIFDEVAEPFKIWMYLENHSEFKKIVQSMNIQTRLTNFLTQVSHRISISKTKTKENTDAKEENLSQTQKTIPEDVSFNLVPEATQTSMKSKLKVRKKISSQKAPVLSLPDKQEEKLEKKIGFLVRSGWRLIILCSFLVAGGILYKISYVPIKKKNQIIKELNTTGKKYYKSGDFNRALPFFERAADYLTQEEKFSYAALLLQNNQPERSSLIRGGITDPAVRGRADWILLEGLGDFYSRRYSKAEKSFQNVILKNNKQTLNQALLNLALLKLESRQYNELINEIKELLDRSFDRGMIWYLKALYFAALGKSSDLENYLIDNLGLEDTNSPLSIEFKQELLFLLAYAYMKNGKTEEQNSVVQKLLNQDPYFIEEYYYSPLIAKNKLNWRLLYPYCNEILNANPERSLIQALYSLCLIKTNQAEEAKPLLEKIKSQEPENALFLSLYAYLLMAQKESPHKIEAVFSLINYDSPSVKENNLAFIMKARFFEQNEYWDSALLVWKDLMRKDIGSLSVWAGLSFNSYQIGDKNTAGFYKKKVLDKYPYHTKVLPLE